MAAIPLRVNGGPVTALAASHRKVPMHRLAAAACLALTLAAALVASPARAEPAAMGDQVVVLLWSGASFRGTLERQDDRHLVLRSASGTVRELPLSSVRTVTREGPSAAPGGPAEPVAVIEAPRHATIATAPPAAAPQARAAVASEPGADQGPRVGVGVSVPGPLDAPAFYVPIQLEAELRLEPEFGYASLRLGGEDATRLQVGLGFLFTRQVAPQVGAYVGLRAQYLRLSATGLQTETAWRVAGAVGGEWQPVPRVGLGAEAQLGYVNVSGGGALGTATGLDTAALLFLRIYLN